MLNLFTVVLNDFVWSPEVTMTLNQTGRNQGCSEALNVAFTDEAIGGPISTTAHDGTPTGNADSTIIGGKAQPRRPL